MPRYIPYSPKENQLLLEDLAGQKNHLNAENIIGLVELWPGFFDGQKRKAYELYRHTILLAQKNGIQIVVDSIPKRDRSKEKKKLKEPSIRHTKGRTYEQIRYIISSEINSAIKRATTKIMQLMETTVQENNDLREEVKVLLPYRNIVEIKYRDELEKRGGS
jgi:hypothetical protein